MKHLFSLLVFVLFGFYCSAQVLIEATKVPKPVQEAFKKRASKSTQIKWFKVKEGFLVKYTFGGETEETLFDKMGEQLKDKVSFNIEKLPKIIVDDIDQNQKKKEIYEAYVVTEGRKDKYYCIILHEQKKRKEEPVVFEIQYTMQGKMITIYEPLAEVEEVAPVDEEPNKSEIKLEAEAEQLAENAVGDKVKIKDLPTEITDYISANYDYNYSYKESKIIEHQTYGEVYCIIMKRQGEKKQYVHYFDVKGKLLEKTEE